MARLIQKGENARRNWLRINEQAGDIAALASAVQALRNGAVSRGQREDFYLHPFQVYVLPDYRMAPADRAPATDWRTVRVRHGYVIQGGVMVATEGCQDSDDEGVTEAPILVPADTAAFFVWLYVAMEDGVPVSAQVQSGTSGWAEFPAPSSDADSAFALIARVDSQTDAGKKRVIIRQFLDEDLVLSDGGDARWS